MRRSILAIGLALLLGFTTVTRPVSAADIYTKAPEMPTKAPPPAPVEAEFCWWCLLLIVPVIVCILECGHHEERFNPMTFGAPKPST